MGALRDAIPDVPSLLALIRERPALYLSAKSVTCLRTLLAGISMAEDFHEIPEASRFGGFDWTDFERWVESTYNPSCFSLNSLGLAGYQAGSEEQGLDLWFQWYDEFRDGKPSG